MCPEIKQTYALSEESGQEKSHFQCLGTVQTGVTGCFIMIVQIVQGNISAQTFRYLFTGLLIVDASQIGAQSSVYLETLFLFGKDVFDMSGLPSLWQVFGIAMHRITAPQNGLARFGDSLNDGREEIFDFPSAKTADECDSPRYLSRVQIFYEFDQIQRIHGRADFDSYGISDTTKVFNMGARQL